MDKAPVIDEKDELEEEDSLIKTINEMAQDGE